MDSGSWWWTGRPGVLVVHGVAKSQTWLRDWTELSISHSYSPARHTVIPILKISFNVKQYLSWEKSGKGQGYLPDPKQGMWDPFCLWCGPSLWLLVDCRPLYQNTFRKKTHWCIYRGMCKQLMPPQWVFQCKDRVLIEMDFEIRESWLNASSDIYQLYDTECVVSFFWASLFILSF